MSITCHDLAKMIDHSLLHPTMTDQDVTTGCELAAHYNVASVCLKPYSVRAASRQLEGTDVKMGSVIGFPHGNSTMAIKVAETHQACEDGAVEIDMVINIGKALGDDLIYVENEIAQVQKAAASHGAIVKVIFENDFLSEKTIVELCRICSRVDVAFVKTSSGYGFVKQPDGSYAYKGATVPHLRLMRTHTDRPIQVKAAGGVRTLRDLLLVRSLGITRIGATATATILDEAAALIEQGINLEDLTPAIAELSSGY